MENRDPEETVLLIQHKDFTSHGSQTARINRQIGMAYLSKSDPVIVERVWLNVMDDTSKHP